MNLSLKVTQGFYLFVYLFAVLDLSARSAVKKLIEDSVVILEKEEGYWKENGEDRERSVEI